MKTNKVVLCPPSIRNRNSNFQLHFIPGWAKKERSYFSITVFGIDRSNDQTQIASLNLGGKEARMLHRFLNKVYGIGICPTKLHRYLNTMSAAFAVIIILLVGMLIVGKMKTVLLLIS